VKENVDNWIIDFIRETKEISEPLKPWIFKSVMECFVAFPLILSYFYKAPWSEKRIVCALAVLWYVFICYRFIYFNAINLIQAIQCFIRSLDSTRNTWRRSPSLVINTVPRIEKFN